MTTKCCHCRTFAAEPGRNGLCWTCRRHKAIRDQYPTIRLTEEEVWGILSDLGVLPMGEIAEKYNVSRQTINNIDNGTFRKDVLERYEAEQDKLTEEQLDAMIAERYPTMPPLTEEERLELCEAPPMVVIRGRGVRMRAKVYRRLQRDEAA